MKADIMTKDGQKKGSVDLPAQFGEALRPDVVKRAFASLEASSRQSYGSDPDAGMKASARVSKKRRDYRGSYGIGISRVPRKVMSRRGTRMNWTGAIAPGTVGGRRAHPPTSKKVWTKSINKKERRLAIRAAIAATISKVDVVARGHKVPASFPIIFTDDVQRIAKTSDVRKALEGVGITDELSRAKGKIIRAGRGTMRGRKYRRKTGPLLVVSDACELQKAARNIPGLSCAVVSNLNVRLLAPGGQAGRLTFFTESAIKRLKEEKLFTEEYKAPKKEVEKAPVKKVAAKPTSTPKPAVEKKPVEKKEEKPVKKE
ncbi:MAG: 50S ribosomal protein L4 [archaeon]